MKDLFEKYKTNNKITEALIVGQNLFNKNNKDRNCFESYYNLLVELVVNSEDYNSGEKYLQQAIAALTYFSENTEMNESTVDFVIEKEVELNKIYEILYEKSAAQKKDSLALKIKENDDSLNLIKKLFNYLQSVNDKNEFDNTIDQIGKVDSTIEKDYLVERQQTEYENLTKKCSELVSEKLKYFERNNNKDYNLKAIEAYEKAFKFFKNNEVVTDHEEVIKGLFAFDASRLFNETLVYYNHVYSYILSKLNDDEKFIITKYAILSESKR